MLLSFLSQIHPTASENSCQQQTCLLAQDLGPGYREKGTSHAPAARGGGRTPALCPPPAAPLPSQACLSPRVCPQDAPRFCLQTLDSVSGGRPLCCSCSSRDGALLTRRGAGTLSGSPSPPRLQSPSPAECERGQDAFQAKQLR